MPDPCPQFDAASAVTGVQMKSSTSVSNRGSVVKGAFVSVQIVGAGRGSMSRGALSGLYRNGQVLAKSTRIVSCCEALSPCFIILLGETRLADGAGFSLMIRGPEQAERTDTTELGFAGAMRKTAWND